MGFGAAGRSGSRGADVVAIQKALNNAGFSVTVDGVFGSGTKAAVVAFQQAAGLTADGIVGPATWDVLKSFPEPKGILVGPAAPASAVSRSPQVNPSQPKTLGPPKPGFLSTMKPQQRNMLFAAIGLVAVWFLMDRK